MLYLFQIKTSVRIYPCICLVAFLLLSWLSNAQHSPALFNYSEKDYRAGHQNWSLTCTEDGTLYSANSDGLLVFDGQKWDLFTLPNKKNIRSVYAVSDTIYCGGFQEMGYWIKDQCDDYSYHSLMHMVPDGAINNEEIWHIISDGHFIYFQSFAVLLAYDGKKVETIPVPGNIMFMQIIDGEKWLPVIDKGLFIWQDNQFKPTVHSAFFSDKIITGMVSLDLDNTKVKLISTQNDGFYVMDKKSVSPWKHSILEEMRHDQINKLIKLPSGDILAGSIRTGLYVVSPSGRLKFRINTKNGLQNNSVLAFWPDPGKGVWVGLDKGISFLSLREEWALFSDNTGIMGTVYALAHSGNKWYVGTNQGVYLHQKDYYPEGFRLMDGTQGQVWHLQTIGEDVWCGHNDGTFIIKDTEVEKISDITGGWCIEYLNNTMDTLLQGNYTGLALFIKNNNQWRLVHRLSGYGMSVKKLIRHSSYQFWVTGPHTGLKLLTVDSAFQRVTHVKNYSTVSGYTNNYIPDIQNWKGQLRVFDGENHLVYDKNKDQLVHDEELNTPHYNDFFFRALNDTIFSKVYTYHSVMYFVRNTHPVITVDSIYIPLRLNKDYHNFSLLDEGIIAMCTFDGYALFDKSHKLEKSNETLYFYKAVISGKNECLKLMNNSSVEVDYHSRDVTLYYRDKNFPFWSDVSYRVLPAGTEWTHIEKPGIIRLVNLPVGEHRLEISREGEISGLRLVVRPPWYFSWWSISIYVCLLVWMIFLIKQYIQKQIQNQNKIISQKNHQLMKEKMVQWENERLLQENLSKNKELANTTRQLIRKNETLLEIKNELIDIRKKGESTLTAKDFQLMLKQINENLSMKEDENLFHTSFEEIHHEFIQKLKSEYPELSKDDILLASYLRMNLTSKEIAPLFNISLRGLENKRYRLRKKMNLPGHLNLNTYFMNYDG